MQHSKRNGSTDRPVEAFEKDEFQIEAYIEGLAEFIEECETPMTIAVQGDWGCGKTSMMNMVRQYLKKSDRIMDVWFNTWQFSQFNMDDKLVITFLQHLIKKLTEQLPEDSKEKKAISSKLKPIMKTIAVGMTKHFVGSDIGEIVDGVLDEAEKKENKVVDLADEIVELKISFQELIQKVADTNGKRVVVFIDDLDRLQPVRAVELLEVLKLFLDCDNCVFVMAIDTSVVFQGIREKYGKDMSNEKAQSFFDKMIQLPFKMPTAYYKLDKMLVRLLDFLSDETMNEAERKKYITIIREVTDGNPRTIKRLSNAVLLMDKVAGRRDLYQNEEGKIRSLIRRILVVLSCVQLRYEAVYGFLVNNITYGHMKRIIDLHLPDKKKANRGELLTKEFYNIGMPRVAMNDELIFYNLMYLYIDLSREFVTWFKERGNTEISAIEKLMRVVSLNNIREAVTENLESQDESGLLESARGENISDAQIVQNEELLIDGEKAALYSGMVLTGNAGKAYRQLTEKRIYPPISLNLKNRDNMFEQEIKELKEIRFKPQESYLFRRMDDILRQHYQVEEKHRAEEEETFTFRYYTGNEELSFKLVFDALERSIQVALPTRFQLKPQMKVFVDYQNLIEKEQQEYRILQQEYGTVIFPDKYLSDIQVERNEEGKVQWISGAFYVINQTMADLLTEFFIQVATDEEALQGADRKETTQNAKYREIQAEDFLSLIDEILP